MSMLSIFFVDKNVGFFYFRCMAEMFINSICKLIAVSGSPDLTSPFVGVSAQIDVMQDFLETDMVSVMTGETDMLVVPELWEAHQQQTTTFLDFARDFEQAIEIANDQDDQETGIGGHSRNPAALAVIGETVLAAGATAASKFVLPAIATVGTFALKHLPLFKILRAAKAKVLPYIARLPQKFPALREWAGSLSSMTSDILSIGNQQALASQVGSNSLENYIAYQQWQELQAFKQLFVVKDAPVNGKPGLQKDMGLTETLFWALNHLPTKSQNQGSVEGPIDLRSLAEIFHEAFPLIEKIDPITKKKSLISIFELIMQAQDAKVIELGPGFLKWYTELDILQDRLTVETPYPDL